MRRRSRFAKTPLFDLRSQLKQPSQIITKDDSVILKRISKMIVNN